LKVLSKGMNPEPYEPYKFNVNSLREGLANTGVNPQEVFLSFFFWLQIVSLFASLFLFLGIVYSALRINQIRKDEREALDQAASGTPMSAVATTAANPRWERIVELSQSDNEGDWRLAIIEADIILSDMMERMQYHGDTLGEKLKQVEKSDFNTIDNAWEAHKMRNQIAHEGSDFILSKRDANRAIQLYESVFREFHFI